MKKKPQAFAIETAPGTWTIFKEWEPMPLAYCQDQATAELWAAAWTECNAPSFEARSRLLDALEKWGRT